MSFQVGSVVDYKFEVLDKGMYTAEMRYHGGRKSDSPKTGIYTYELYAYLGGPSRTWHAYVIDKEGNRKCADWTIRESEIELVLAKEPINYIVLEE